MFDKNSIKFRVYFIGDSHTAEIKFERVCVFQDSDRCISPSLSSSDISYRTPENNLNTKNLKLNTSERYDFVLSSAINKIQTLNVLKG